jgi:hypothetical protein
MTTPSLIARRRRHGPEPLPRGERRTHTISVRLNPMELALLDAKRGRLARGEWMRAALLCPRRSKSEPPGVRQKTWTG